MQARDLGAHLHAQFGIEIGERLVEQEHFGLAHDGPAHGHALTLATGECGGFAIQEFPKLEDLGRLLDALVDLFLR